LVAKLKRRNHLEDLGVDEVTIIKYIFEKYYVKDETGSRWSPVAGVMNMVRRCRALQNKGVS
jgi:hypothetical protein